MPSQSFNLTWLNRTFNSNDISLDRSQIFHMVIQILASISPGNVSSTENPIISIMAHEDAVFDLSYLGQHLGVFLIVVFGTLLAFLTIVGNLMVMISFKIDRQLQTISNYFLFSLAVADIAIGLISIPLMTYYTAQSRWSLGYVMCQFWLCVDYLMSNASVLNLLLISFDRYFSVTRPLTYRPRRTTGKAMFMIALTYIVSAILWPPWIVGWPYIEGRFLTAPGSCVVQFLQVITKVSADTLCNRESCQTNPYITVGTAIAAFYLPVTIMIVLYSRVYWETQKRQVQLRNLQADSSDGETRRKRRKGRKDDQDDTRCAHWVVYNYCYRNFCRHSWRFCRFLGLVSDSPSDSRRSSENFDDLSVALLAESAVLSNPLYRPASRLENQPELSPFGPRRSMDASMANRPDSLHSTLIAMDTIANRGGNQKALSVKVVPTVAEELEMKSSTNELNDVISSELLSLKPVVRNKRSMSDTNFEIDSNDNRLNRFKVLRMNNDTKRSPTIQRQTSAGIPNDSKKSIKEYEKHRRKQRNSERKAAKTLSAILLAFIVTWTPYNAIVCWEAFFPNTFSNTLFAISYYLCYINSTVNPLCYALCNARFRLTYLRIVKCRWKESRSGRGRMVMTGGSVVGFKSR